MITNELRKRCPDLLIRETKMSRQIEGDSSTDTQYKFCLRHGCSAYKEYAGVGVCMKYETIVWEETMESYDPRTGA